MIEGRYLLRYGAERDMSCVQQRQRLCGRFVSERKTVHGLAIELMGHACLYSYIKKVEELKMADVFC
ncbi:hypothetical protein [Zymobacter sp. IVIA_5232.4 C2]|uniref:hypothetical protein n=1 Tax=Zymobacter sp. IVIA_5232.4 C2 TaxID=3394855 RepID=UPI0039C123FE